jgi:CHAT domain-containing protein/triacylglycerol esterase/lipase EstA (alpha/beta hydrolase family)
MASYVLPGQAVGSVKDDDVPEYLSDLLEVTETHETWLGTSRGGAAAQARTDVGDLADDDIVEIRLEGGLKLWQSVADTRADFAAADRSATDQALLVPRRLRIGDGADSRGGAGYAVEGVKVLKSKFTGKAGEMSALALAHHIENKLDLGFHRCVRDESGEKPVIKHTAPRVRSIDTSKPMLVLVHGTFSSTQGSFGDLVDDPDGRGDLWQSLESAFPAGIYALEHRSVTVDPIRNALDLVRALPRGARLSLLSHSRGGLVAELVARAARIDPETGATVKGAYDDADRAILKKAGESTDLLDQLSAELEAKQITVDRVIRIAGPLGGTTLASKRLDRALSIALNSLELVPALKASVAYDLLKSFLLGFVKAKNVALPGLEAMMPSSALIRLVNQADALSAGSLHIVSGDNDGNGVFRRLRNLAVDLFFGSDNDFVVNTPSMARGLARLARPTQTMIVSPEITHFGYFSNAKGRNAILNAATSAPAPVIADNSGEGLIAEPTRPGIRVSRARDRGSLPVCFYLPGVMGTHLRHESKWVWSNPFRMATGGLGRLRMPGTGVTPDEMMDRYYGDLARFLSRSHDVILFPYDWREDVLTTGAEVLAEDVRKALDETDKPIRFVAHSMGGLVVRAFIDAHPALWSEVKRRQGSRFVMLGTPNGGAFSMAHTMMGRAKAIRQLAALDITNSMEEILEIVTSMAGPAQLLPADSDGHYLKAATWNELRQFDDGNWVVPPDRVFDASRAAHAVFKRQTLDPDLVCYVAGVGREVTPTGIRIDQSASGSGRVQFLGTWAGDGTVTWATGIPDGIEPYYMDAIHGDLARTSSAFPAILDLLTTGQTSALSRTPPARARGAETQPAVLRDEELEVFPAAEDVLDSFMGAGTPQQVLAEPPVRRTTVTIRHGDLRFTRSPVLVGHYLGDPIDGAEAALDGWLDHSLTEVRDLGLYPGAVETCEVLLRDKHNPGGAVIAGLGRFGELTPGDLRRTVNRAVLRYVLALRRRAAERCISFDEMDDISLTTLLIGHTGANMTVQQSVQAILEAVINANITLKETPIAHLEFVELYEDTAFKAASAIHSATLNGPVSDKIVFDRRITSGDGAMLRMNFGAESSAWQRITVTRPEDDLDVLNFTVIADGAKAHFQQTAVDTDVIQRLLEQSRLGTETDRELGRLLFQLLIPLELKAFAQSDQKIQLIVDETTADIPWELLEDAVSVLGDGLYESTGDTDFRPLVVRTPVLRQLVSPGAVVPRVPGRKALVIGDPLLVGYPEDMGLRQLPGAKIEAELVKKRLEKGVLIQNEERRFDVTSFIQTDNAIDILSHIMRSDAKIMHIAAHGLYDDGDHRAKAGLVLPNGITLTSATFSGMEMAPEFVFLNCCHLGRIERNTGPIAASLSRTLIDKGVRAVIAAGWAVDDTAAHLFAEEFYGSMLNGNTFGDAIHHARQVVFDHDPSINTWGAYQSYGDPDYRFFERDQDKPRGQRRRTFYSADHARKAAINIARGVGSPHLSRGDLVAELDALMADAPEEWREDARWCEAMGRAYAKLDLFAPAIENLELAKANHRSNMTVHALELLEDLKVRAATYAWTSAEHAAQSATEAERKAAKAVAEARKKDQKAAVTTALDNLAALDAFLGGLNERREALKGAVCKRKVLSYPKGAPRQSVLAEMIGHYRSAMDLAAVRNPGQFERRSCFNWLSGHVVAGHADADGQSFETVFDQLLAQNAEQEKIAPNFWTAVLPAEIGILRGLLAAPDARDALFERFEETFQYAWRRGGAYGQARSIREHVHFLKSVARDAGQVAWMTRIQVFLNDLTWTYRDEPKKAV